jgi:hypothetical protein
MRSCLTILVAVLAVVPASAQVERARDEQLLLDADIKIDGPALLRFFRERTPTEEQRRRISELIRQFGDKSFRVRRDAAEQVRKIGLPAIGLLHGSLNDPDPEIVRACEKALADLEKVPSDALAAAAARLLGSLKPEGAVDMILAQLATAADGELNDALRDSLAKLAVSNGKPDPRLIAALADPSPVRRGAAAEALTAAKAAAIEPQVRKLLNDADPEVRLRVALALAEFSKDKNAIPQVIAGLPNAPKQLGWKVEDLLVRLADGTGPQVSLAGDQTKREECRKAWAQWWQANADKVKMVRLDEAPREYGYTLVLEMGANGQGKALEFAPDGKTVRWQIDGLVYPVDAQVLPNGNRVLIAEYNGQRVTERDFRGRILWSRQIVAPIGCQRLHDGSTVIAHRRGLIEVNAKDEQVFRYNSDKGDIVGGRKARDGTYVLLTRLGLLMRVNAQGKVVKSFTTTRTYGISALELLQNGRALVTNATGVVEYDLATGKQVWRANVRSPMSATRAADGKTLVSSTLQRRVIVLDHGGTPIKEFAMPDGGVPYRALRR